MVPNGSTDGDHVDVAALEGGDHVGERDLHQRHVVEGEPGVDELRLDGELDEVVQGVDGDRRALQIDRGGDPGVG